MNWHPFAESFPLLEGDERDALKSSIKATGGNAEQPIHYRVTCGEMQGLDGRNRWLVCKELKLKPTLKKVSVTDDDVAEFIVRRNITRRHLTKELRQTIVAEWKEQGKSNRAIAGALGTDEKTIRNDVKEIIDSGAEVSAPEKVTGKDLKSYPAAKPKILCGRCQRVGETPGCEACKEERAAARTGREAGSVEPKDETPKAGKVLFDWSAFNREWGAVLRQVDKLGKAYRCKESKDAEKLRDELQAWKDSFKAWYKSVAKTAAPKD